MRIVERLHTEATQRQREQESRRVVLGRYGAVTNEAWAAKGESTDYEVRDRLAGAQGTLLNVHVRVAAILGGGACLGGGGGSQRWYTNCTPSLLPDPPGELLARRRFVSAGAGAPPAQTAAGVIAGSLAGLVAALLPHDFPGAPSQSHTHTYIHAHTKKALYTHTYIHTHIQHRAHTHTYTVSPSLSVCLSLCLVWCGALMRLR
jgi:hypothetical protein